MAASSEAISQNILGGPVDTKCPKANQYTAAKTAVCTRSAANARQLNRCGIKLLAMR